MKTKTITLLKHVKRSALRWVSRISLLYLTVKNLLDTRSGVNTAGKRDQNVIVSLTSYPKRIPYVHLTLETILSQTFKPDKIILWLSSEESQKADLPHSLLHLEKRGVEIRYVENNLRSYKKLIYALKEYANDVIVTADDDVLYPRWWLNNLYKAHLETPKAVIGYRGRVMQKEQNGTYAPYKHWKVSMTDTHDDALLLTGVGGILYPPNVLDGRVFDEHLFMKIAPNADDIWFKAMAMLRGTLCRKVYEKSIDFPVIDGTQECALWNANFDKNDQQLNQIFTYYGLLGDGGT